MRTFSKIVIVSLLSALLLLLGGCGKSAMLTVVFPKLGSADAAVLMTKDATVVIDTGEISSGDNLLEILSDNRRDTVDLLVISHYDKDHVGGAAKLLKECDVKRVIGSTSPKVSDETANYYAALSELGLTEEVLSEPLSLELGGMKLTILPPQKAVYDEDQSNNASTVVTVQFGDTSMFFAGDAMAERMEELTPGLKGSSFDLIKLPHHGRDTDTTTSLLPFFKAGAAAVITSSKKEPESEMVLNLLTDSGVTVYRTLEGTVTATSDGTSLTIEQT